ncbi:RNA ligase [uncultured archaeon]|nr:RNA ligase [uncultured archaeon]
METGYKSGLATVQKLSSLKPIEGADKIELAQMEGMGWVVVVQKGLHTVGDLVCFIPIDIVCPDKPWFSFLKDRHFRVRTVRLRGQLSQGIILPLSVLEGSGFKEGDDITELLGVKKYEKEVPQGGSPRGTRPNFIPKTDEDRLQSYLRLLQEIKGVKVYITTKCDGSSCTFFYRKSPELEKGEFGVCSRQQLYAEDDINAFSSTARTLGIHEKMEAFGCNIAVQGELVGPGIQKNKMGLPSLQFLAFNAWDIDNQRYIGYEESRNIFAALGMTPVPLVEVGKTLEEIFGKDDITIDDLLKYSEGSYDSGEPREGIVIRPMSEMYSDVLRGRLSFKVVNNKFLEKWKE